MQSEDAETKVRDKETEGKRHRRGTYARCIDDLFFLAIRTNFRRKFRSFYAMRLTGLCNMRGYALRSVRPNGE